MAKVQIATQDWEKSKIEKTFNNGCKYEAQGWGLADCFISACAMFNFDTFMASQYLHYTYQPINEGMFEEQDILKHLNIRLQELGIKI